MDEIQKKKNRVYAKAFEENLSILLRFDLLELAEKSIDLDTFEIMLDMFFVCKDKSIEELEEKVDDLENELDGSERDYQYAQSELEEKYDALDELSEEIETLKDKSLTYQSMHTIMSERDEDIKGLKEEIIRKSEKIASLTSDNERISKLLAEAERSLEGKDIEYKRWLQADRLIQEKINDKAW